MRRALAYFAAFVDLGFNSASVSVSVAARARPRCTSSTTPSWSRRGRVDVLVNATEVGIRALHCHILSHAEGDDGMFGMVTALIVEKE